MYYTIIDFNFGRHEDLSTRKGDIVNITFKGGYILMSAEIEVINCFVIWGFIYPKRWNCEYNL